MIFILILFALNVFAQPGINPADKQEILLVFTQPMDSAGFRDRNNFIVYSVETGDTVKVDSAGVPLGQPFYGFTEFIIYTKPLNYDEEYIVKVINVKNTLGFFIVDANQTFILLPLRIPGIPKPVISLGDNIPISYILIEAGGFSQYTDLANRIWIIDHSFVDGNTVNRGNIPIMNTVDDKIYQTERWGVTGYNITVPNAFYIVKLHFAETSVWVTQIGQRIFSIDVEGQQLNDLDIIAESGMQTALIKVFNVIVTDGELNIIFIPKVQNTMINGIEILRM